MTSGLYCSGCKRIVWHPYVQDVDYYLNERHPQHESDCLYHDGGSEYPGSSASSTDSYAGVFKGNGTSTSTQGGKKKTNREKKTADPFRNMGNRMAGQRNAFEHMKSQLEQYRGQADTCQRGTYSSQSAKNIMDRVNSERGRKKPFTGILIAVAIYAIGGGLLEVLISPIIEACPTDNKETAMSLLHSFYCWGHVGVVLISTIFFSTFGIANWKILARIWAVIPVLNGIVFLTSPIYSLHEEGEKGLSIKELCSMKIFWVVMLMMTCAGASEQAVSQWASTFAEEGLKVSKTVGDLAGPMAFAGFVSSSVGNNLRMGILAAIVFPVLLLMGIQICKKSQEN